MATGLLSGLLSICAAVAAPAGDMVSVSGISAIDTESEADTYDDEAPVSPVMVEI